jgi:AcrR family transcriptional regulator
LRRPREEASAAILAAAADLFAERGPARTSIRDIAAEAKLNHALVFRYFGSKEQLVSAVLNYLAEQQTAALEAGALTEDPILNKLMWVQARTVLDGYPIGELQSHFPNATAMVNVIRPLHDTDSSARLAAANAIALQCAWRLFSPLFLAATDIADMPAPRVQNSVNAAIARIVQMKEVPEVASSP